MDIKIKSREVPATSRNGRIYPLSRSVVTSIATSSGSGGGTSSAESHNRRHDVTNELDHTPAAEADRDKLLGSNASTGAIEFIGKLWKRVGSYIKTYNAADSIELDNESGIIQSWALFQMASDTVGSYLQFIRRKATNVAVTASSLLGSITWAGQSNTSGGDIVGARIDVRVGTSNFSDANGGSSVAISTCATNQKDAVQRWKVNEDGTLSQEKTAIGGSSYKAKTTCDVFGSFSANMRIFTPSAAVAVSALTADDFTVLVDCTYYDAVFNLTDAQDFPRRIVTIRLYRVGINKTLNINALTGKYIKGISDYSALEFTDAGEYVTLQSIATSPSVYNWYVIHSSSPL